MSAQPPPAGWGAPPPPKRDRYAGREWYARPWAIITGLVLAVVVLGVVVSGEDDTTTVTTAADTEPAASGEPQPTEPAAKGPLTVPVGRAITAQDALGREVAVVAVSRARLSRGDEFKRPERGRYLLLHVQVKALRDNITTPDLYVLQGTEKLDQTFTGMETGPGYETYKQLSHGQSHQGTIVFDVPAAHGRVVLPDSGGKPIGYWTF